MWTRAIVMTGASALTLAVLGCAPKATVPAVTIEEKSYMVVPDAIVLKAGVMTGQMTKLKVMERVEQGSGTVVSPAKLSGTLSLKNTSTDQTVRLLEGKIRFIDAQGKPMMDDAKVVERTFKFSSYGQTDRLDPGQESTQNIDVDFPAQALKASQLKTIRIGLVYLPASYREETLELPVAIGAK